MSAPMEVSLRQFSRLTLGYCHGSATAFPWLPVCCRQIWTRCSPLAIQATQSLQAEPVKKKARIDTSVLVQREQKRKKKIEKSIKKLVDKGRILKPVEEISGFRQVLKTLGQRKRDVPEISEDEKQRRLSLHRAWAHYKAQQHAQETKAIQRAIDAQSRALDELQAESEELYVKAISRDEQLIPFEARGPTQTPPIEGYLAPDGEVINATYKFEGETEHDVIVIK